MSHPDQAFADLIAANPVPADGEPPAPAWTAAALLDEIDSRDAAARLDQLRRHRGDGQHDLPVDALDARLPIGSRRGARWAVAATIVVLVSVVVTITLAGDDTDVETDATTVLTTAPPTPSTDPPAEADDVSAASLGDPHPGWYRIDGTEDLSANVDLVDVTTLGTRFVAVGEIGVVVSDDGVDWTFHAVIPEAEPDGWLGKVRMEAVVEGGPGLVAVGHVFDFDRNRAAVWTSVDGTAWERVPHDDEIFGHRETYMVDIVVGGPGLVAVGEDADSGFGGMAVWTSVDGTAWTRVTDLPPHQGAFEGGLREIVAGGPGLVTVGEGGIYVSADGTNWSQSQDGEVESVFAIGSALVAVPDGSFGDRILTSEDGLTWTEVVAPPLANTVEIAAVDDGFVLVAGRKYRGPTSFWTSTDGLEWTLVSSLEGVDFDLGFAAVTPGGPGAVAVGGSSIWVYTEDAEAAAALGDRVTSLREMPVEDTKAAQSLLPDRVAIIDAMLSAYNEGRYEDWLAFFAGPDVGGHGLSAEVEEGFMAANGTWSRNGDCSTEARRVTCPTTRRDDFYGAGGIERKLRFTFVFEVAGTVIETYESSDDSGPADHFDAHAEFADRFRDWLRQTHPGAAVGSESGFMLAQSMPTALEHVEEFVALSDDYPLGDRS